MLQLPKQRACIFKCYAISSQKTSQTKDIFMGVPIPRNFDTEWNFSGFIISRNSVIFLRILEFSRKTWNSVIFVIFLRIYF